MEDGGSAFDFEALDEDSEQLSISISTPTTVVADQSEVDSESREARIDVEDDSDTHDGRGFASLKPQYIDVLSDWGETEKFVIDGDSLLLHAMLYQQIDWSHGGQFLHLSFAVEHFLNDLIIRGGLFSIVFFEVHERMWKQASQILARRLLIQHLKQCLPAAANVVTLASPYSEEWLEFLQSFQPSLLAIADAPPHGSSSDNNQFPLLRFAQICCRSGINLLLLREVELSENVLRGFYVQSRRNASGNALWLADAPTSAEPSAFQPGSAKEVDAFLGLSNVKKDSVGDSWRVLACAWACSAWLQGGASASKEAAELLAKAFMVHIVMIKRGCISLEQRACPVRVSSGPTTVAFLDFIFAKLASSAWPHCTQVARTSHDMCDVSDGRLFHSLLSFIAGRGSADAASLGLDQSAADEAQAAWGCVVEGAALFPMRCTEQGTLLVEDAAAQTQAVPAGEEITLAPVSGCTLFEQAMESGGIKEAAVGDAVVQAAMFPQTVLEQGWNVANAVNVSFLWTHCRDQSASAEPSSRSMSEWERRRQLRWKARQSQMYFRHLHEYATSLAGTTVLGASASSSGGSPASSAKSTTEGSVEEGNEEGEEKEEKDSGKKGGGGGKKGAAEKKKPEKKLSKKEQMLADIEAKKQKGVASKLDGEWKELKGALDKSGSYVAKIKDLDDFVVRCLAANQMALALEVTLRKLNECKDGWAEDRQARTENMKFAIMTFECVRTILTTHAELIKDAALPTAQQARTDVVLTMVQLGFVDTALAIADTLLDAKHEAKRKEFLAEAQEIAKTHRSKLSVQSKSSAHFQLEHMGHLLPRPPPKTKDPRITTFTPDDWQRTLLDAVDARDCALVCAPTSSGKTFISHYCMDKVMHDTKYKDGVVVFVAPTKALINQIAAQVYGAFHSQFGIYTDAYRHRALTCRILITVPECLESLLVSPASAVWSQKIRYVILDEIHCISTPEEGKVWEHILLMLNSPFLALSATVGEPDKFVSWLQRIKDLQRAVDGGSRDESYEVKLVQHSERFVDLRRHVYLGTEEWDTKAAAATVKYARLHLRARVDHTSATVDGAEFLETLHPLVSFTSAQLQRAEIPHNLKFEPKDSLSLVNAMLSVVRRTETAALAARKEALEQLDPLNYFKGDQHFIMKPQAVRYENDVKNELTLWMKEGWREDVVKVLRSLGNTMVVKTGGDGEDDSRQHSGWMDRLFHLMCVLHRQDRLPAVVFNFDRALCERIAFHFLDVLQKAEDAAREEHAKTLAKSKRTAEQKEKVQKRMRDKVLSEKKEIEMLDEMAEMEDTSAFDSSVVDEHTFRAQFSFVQEGRGSAQDFDRITESVRKTMGEAHPMISILRHGIGIHHNGLQNKYKMAVEMLFRCGYLRIVVSTETLAYGINMPCRSVVFAGDSISLNSIQYQQMSGRAGRRGLDVLGHIVFFEVPRYKVHRLIVAPVPRLRGHLPVPSSLLLRMLTLYGEVPNVRGSNAEITKRVRNSVLRAITMPLYFAEREKLAVVSRVQYRVALDLLVKFGLIKPDGGVPWGLAALADHLHFTEPANFALIVLVQSGALHELCQMSDDRTWDAVSRDLMIVLSFLFCRHKVHPSIARDEKLRASSSSVICLPPLPAPCQSVLSKYNATALSELLAMARASASLLPEESHSTSLPLSKASFSSGEKGDAKNLAGDFGEGLLGARDAGSGGPFTPFALLSGGTNERVTLEGVIARARDDISLHRAAVPVMVGGDGGADGNEMINAYVLDFFTHGHFAAIVRDNGIPSGVAWQGLKTFQLILVSLSKSIEAVAPASDPLNVGLARLEQEFSTRFFSKLYK